MGEGSHPQDLAVLTLMYIHGPFARPSAACTSTPPPLTRKQMCRGGYVVMTRGPLLPLSRMEM